MTIPYQTGGLDVWPDAEQLVISWLKPNMPGVNIRTETNTTFGTTSPDPPMALPLVLVQQVHASRKIHAAPADRLDETLTVDIECYGANRGLAWELYHLAHAWMMRANTQKTSVGTFDDIWLESCMGIVTQKNANLRRVIATYGISVRPQASA